MARKLPEPFYRDWRERERDRLRNQSALNRLEPKEPEPGEPRRGPVRRGYDPRPEEDRGSRW